MIYLVYGLSGSMKKMFTDILREMVTHVDPLNTLNPSNSEQLETLIENCKFNIKGVTRSERYYDDGLMLYKEKEYNDDSSGIKKSVYDVMIQDTCFEKEFMYQSEGENNDNSNSCNIWYAINMFQIKKTLEKNADHFVVCNNVDIIKKLIDKFGASNFKIIKIYLKNIRACFDYLSIKYQRQPNKDDIEIDARIKKATNLIVTEQKVEIANVFNKLKETEDLIEDIEIGDYKDETIEAILRKRLFEILNKYSKRFDWKRLLTCRKMFDEKYKAEIYDVNKKNDGTESLLYPFIRDYNNISSLSIFRRMQDKCQVFPLKRYDYARTRLTHSIEVAATAEELGESAVRFIKDRKEEQDYDRVCRCIPILLRNAALLHDMGNPPFGHFSEDAIRLWFFNNMKHIRITDDGAVFDDSELRSSQYTLSADMQYDLLYYEGNAQLLRLLTTLADMRESEKDGSELISPNLTMATIAATIKYPTSGVELHDAKSKKDNDICRKKNGYFFVEDIHYKKINMELGLNNRRHPLTFLLEAADDITYYASDLEDALKKKLISLEGVLKEAQNLNNDASLKISETRRADYQVSDVDKKQFGIVVSDRDKWVSLAEKGLVKFNMFINNLERWIREMNQEDEHTRLVKSELLFKALRAYIKDHFIESTKDAFRENYDSIMLCKKGFSFKGELLDLSDSLWMKVLIRGILQKYVYCSDELVRNQIKAAKVLDTLLKEFVMAAVKIGYENKDLKDDDLKNSGNNIYSKNIFSLFSENYRLKCKRENIKIDELENAGKIKIDDAKQRKVYNCLLLAMDVLTGMTDSFAMEMYHLITASK